MLLCYWAWLKNDKYWQVGSLAQLVMVQTAVSKMLHELVTCIPRLRGNGWNIPKIHENFPMAFYIFLFGAHINMYMGPTEHNHIEISKDTA